MSIQRHSRRLSAAAVAVALGLLMLLAPLARPASAASAVPALDSTFATLLNTLRAARGLGTLSLDNELSNIARNWSGHMAGAGNLSHNGALTSQATGWAKLGENVGTGGAVTQIFDALVASPPHMRNMSDGDFTRIGVGTVSDPSGRLWTTHVFMRPKAAGAVAVPAPTTPPATRAPAPATTRAPKPVATTAAPVTAPPTTAAPVPVPPPVPTTVAVPVAAAANALPTEAAVPVAPAMDPLSSSSAPGPGTGPLVLVGVGLLALLAVAGGGFLLRGRRRPPTPALPASFAATSGPRPAPPAADQPEEDLTKVLDLLYN